MFTGIYIFRGFILQVFAKTVPVACAAHRRTVPCNAQKVFFDLALCT